ncbi:MAG: hypothetical protein RLP09_09115, partial [Sandaracinaceae bacterium]
LATAFLTVRRGPRRATQRRSSSEYFEYSSSSLLDSHADASRRIGHLPCGEVLDGWMNERSFDFTPRRAIPTRTRTSSQ